MGITPELRKKISETTLAGLERQRQTGSTGPNGYGGPGRPRATVDAAQAQIMRENGLSYQAIAQQFGCSKATILRLFKRVSGAPDKQD